MAERERSAKEACYKHFSNYDFKIIDGKLLCDDNGKPSETFWPFDFQTCQNKFKDERKKKH